MNMHTIIGFVIGVAWLQQQASLPGQPVLWLLLALAFVFRLSLRWLSGVQTLRVYRVVLIVSGALLGVIWASLVAWNSLNCELPVEWEGRDITLIGTVSSLPQRFERGVRFHFHVENAQHEGDAVPMPPKVALSWYSGFGDETSQPVPDISPGQRWRLTVRLKRPHGNANPYGFDYEAWLLEQNVRATGYVRPDGSMIEKNELLTPFVKKPGYVVERIRGWLANRISAAQPDGKYAGVLVALVIGDQRGIAQSDWIVFNRTGISHLVSISGLHITMLSGMAVMLTSWLWRRSFFTRAQLPLLIPAQKVAAFAGVSIAFLYVMLAGFGVPAQRTLYMLSVVAAALWSGRIARVSHVVLLALGVTVLLDPWAVLWPGFWLSFGAVAIILYASLGRTSAERRKSYFWRWYAALRSASRTQAVVTLGLVPLTMLLFGQVSLVSPVANAIAIPLVSFIVTPLALVGSVLPQPLSIWILGTAHCLIEWLARLMAWMSVWPQAVWTAPIPSAGIFLFALAGTLWMLAPRGWPSRWLGCVAWLPLVFGSASHPAEGDMWVTAFDVGQGSAVLVETKNHRLLFDAGPAYSPEADGGNRVILPYLRSRGINALDGMVVSHHDNDHSGGMQSIPQGIPVGWISSSFSSLNADLSNGPDWSRCQAGLGLIWDGVRFDMLHPTPGSYASTKWKPNARSCMLKVTAGDRSILLTGDIGVLQEDELIGSIPEKLRATVLVAPHHGSGSSSSLPFLQAVRPEIALFQVGYRNRYGHPKQDVYQRYANLGIERLRTDETGAITMRFEDSFMVSKERETGARYWHGR